MKSILSMSLLAILSLAVGLTIRPAIEVTFEEATSPNRNPAPYNLRLYQESAPKSDLISTGNPTYDQFDSYIINVSNHYGITDMLMVKALIMQESFFDSFTISPDIPCGIPDGWTAR